MLPLDKEYILNKVGSGEIGDITVTDSSTRIGCGEKVSNRVLYKPPPQVTCISLGIHCRGSLRKKKKRVREAKAS